MCTEHTSPPTIDPIDFAVVGCGHIGQRHLAVIAAEPGARLVAFCDVDQQKLATCAARYPDARAYTDYERMLRDTSARVIAICTPHGLHSIMSIQAAYAGKHILVEKPMALTSIESERMIAAAADCGVKLYVVKQNRYNRPILLTKGALDAGRLGRPLMVQCNVIWNRNAAYYALARQPPPGGRGPADPGQPLPRPHGLVVRRTHPGQDHYGHPQPRHSD